MSTSNEQTTSTHREDPPPPKKKPPPPPPLPPSLPKTTLITPASSNYTTWAKGIHAFGDLALPMVAFYMLVLSNFMGEILGCKLQKIMRTSAMAKHVVGIVLLLTLITFADDSNDNSLISKFLITLSIYLWFFITTKCPTPIMFIVLIILLMTYMIGKNSIHDPEYVEHRGVARISQTILSMIALTLSIAGFFIYAMKKWRKHRSSFSLYTILTDTMNCDHRSINQRFR
jgi:hypothetical protein